MSANAETWDRAGDLQIFSLMLSQLSYRGLSESASPKFIIPCDDNARNLCSQRRPRANTSIWLILESSPGQFYGNDIFHH